MDTVIFDAFGTLVKIHDGSHPYRKILKEGIRQGRRPKPEDARTIMTNNWSLAEAAECLEIKITSDLLAKIEGELTMELENIEAFTDGLSAVALLQAQGIKVGVCSNLAKPYASAIERLYPSLDAYTYSFAVGTLKPEHSIYIDSCDKLSSVVARTAMVGDSLRCDKNGPREFGITGWFLSREGHGDFSELQSFADFIIRSK